MTANMYQTTISREACLLQFGGYTEIGDKRLVAANKGDIIVGNPAPWHPEKPEGAYAVFVGYEFDKNGSPTNIDSIDAVRRIKYTFPTVAATVLIYGGYISGTGKKDVVVEENGFAVSFTGSIAKPNLMAIAASTLRDAFNQECVILVHPDGEAEFI
jgi:hypothetical protein